MIAHSRGTTLEEKIGDALSQAQGAYSLLLLTPHKLVAVRDSFGFRPLVLGRLKNAYVVASETTALDLIEAEFIRELEPGEILSLAAPGPHSIRPFSAARLGRAWFRLPS